MKIRKAVRNSKPYLCIITSAIAALVMFCFLFQCTAVTFRDAPATSVPDFKQDDDRWANYVYSSHGDQCQTIQLTGCGLCAMADIIAAWYDESITPIDLAKISMRMCTVAYDGGTYTQFFRDIVSIYPFSDFKETADIDTAIDCLNDGGLVIVKFISGVWNPDKNKRHVCCIYAYENEHFWLHDSGWSDGLMSRILGHGSYDAVKSAADMFMCYWK